MNEKRLLILVTVLVVALVGMIGVQAYHLQKLNNRMAQMQEVMAPPAATAAPSSSSNSSPSSPPPVQTHPIQKQPASPWIDDFWLSSNFGSDEWNPFEEIQRMQEQMDRMFSSTLNQFHASPNFSAIATDSFFLPELDLKEEQDKYVATLDLPGLDQSLVNIEVDNQTLTVSGEREEAVKDEDENGRIIRQERSVGRFERRVALPGPVDRDKVDARYENGVLTITLPKAATAPSPRKVPLNSGNPTPSS